MRGHQRLSAVVVVAALGLAAVACGGSDTAAKDTTTTAAKDGASGNVDVSAFTGDCGALSAAFASAGASIRAAYTGAGADVEKAAEYFRTVADKLPKDIRADFALFADAYAAFAKAMVDAKIDVSDPSSVSPEKLAELEAISKEFSSPAIAKASANVQAYIQKTCPNG